MNDEEFGPWIDHDGKGCPVVGQVVRAVDKTSDGLEAVFVCVAGEKGGYSWDWQWSKKPTPNGRRATRVIRYQVKKPKGLKMLEELIQNLPVPTKEMEKT